MVARNDKIKVTTQSVQGNDKFSWEKDMIKLKRYSDKPILEPVEHHTWEKSAVFNCGVYYDKELVYMLYRASDTWDKAKFISSFGYAVSKNGYNFYRFDKPIFKGEGPQE